MERASELGSFGPTGRVGVDVGVGVAWADEQCAVIGWIGGRGPRKARQQTLNGNRTQSLAVGSCSVRSLGDP